MVGWCSEGELRGKPANPGPLGRVAVKLVHACVYNLLAEIKGSTSVKQLTDLISIA